MACPQCNGTGSVSQMAGNMKFNLTCPRCNGKGRLKNACPTCHGDGRLAHTETVEVRIPAGAQNGSRLRVPGKGNAGTMGAPPGDLYITTHVEDHPLFRREGDNILLKVPITVAEAGLGAKIEVPTIDGKTLLKIPPGTQNDQKFRLRDRGIFNPRKNARGDQIVQVTLKAPLSGTSAPRNCCANWRSCIPKIRAKSSGRRIMSMREKSKAAYMISSVAEQYGVHPQTLRLYEREGLLKPSRSDGNTRLYTDEDLERLEVILHLTRDLGVNLAGVEIILNMRAKMEAMQGQIEDFVQSLNHELANRPRPERKEEQNSLIPVIQFVAKRRSFTP